jgi:TetR/AcrR family transcriptional regulator
MTKKNPSWLRARQPEQIEERRHSILAAASTLLDQSGLEGTGINAIARQAGLSKANLYRYFESREAILLQLLLDEHERWLKTLGRKLKKLDGCQNGDLIAEALTSALGKHPRYCQMVGSLANVLEQNVSADTIRAFKRELVASANSTVAALHQAHQELTPEKAQWLLVVVSMQASGIWPHCHPSPEAQKVLAEEEFTHFRLDFHHTLLASAKGLISQLL